MRRQAIASEVTRSQALKIWDIAGRDDNGDVEICRIELALNPEWTPETADEEYRYRVVVTLVEADLVTEYEGFDDRRSALDYARSCIQEAEDTYAEREADRRQSIAGEVEDTAQHAVEGSVEADLLLTVARLIGRNKAGAALDAIRAANLA
jgi:hypothetical protein